MDRFLRFIAGVALAVAYAVVVMVVANLVASALALPDPWGIYLAAVILGWIAIIVVAFRKDQPWIGYGVIAAPFIALLIVTISCFAMLSTQAIAPGSITGFPLLL
jgi:hypothetical protein